VQFGQNGAVSKVAHHEKRIVGDRNTERVGAVDLDAGRADGFAEFLHFVRGVVAFDMAHRAAHMGIDGKLAELAFVK